jgi:hypothetical protein
MEFKFGFANIVELGNTISKKMIENGISEKAELTVYLDEEEFRKVDEDLFYRMRKNNTEQFIPSNGEINLNFENVKIIIKVKS